MKDLCMVLHTTRPRIELKLKYEGFAVSSTQLLSSNIIPALLLCCSAVNIMKKGHYGSATRKAKETLSLYEYIYTSYTYLSIESSILLLFLFFVCLK
jgi:hypothetical protein